MTTDLTSVDMATIASQIEQQVTPRRIAGGLWLNLDECGDLRLAEGQPERFISFDGRSFDDEIESQGCPFGPSYEVAIDLTTSQWRELLACLRRLHVRYRSMPWRELGHTIRIIGI